MQSPFQWIAKLRDWIRGKKLIPIQQERAIAPRVVRLVSPKEFYDSVDLLPAGYLTVHQPSEPDRVTKIKALAEQRRQVRNAKRFANSLR